MPKTSRCTAETGVIVQISDLTRSSPLVGTYQVLRMLSAQLWWLELVRWRVWGPKLGAVWDVLE